jgi:hypothetical protein
VYPFRSLGDCALAHSGRRLKSDGEHNIGCIYGRGCRALAIPWGRAPRIQGRACAIRCWVHCERTTDTATQSVALDGPQIPGGDHTNDVEASC